MNFINSRIWKGKSDQNQLAVRHVVLKFNCNSNCLRAKVTLNHERSDLQSLKVVFLYVGAKLVSYWKWETHVSYALK